MMKRVKVSNRVIGDGTPVYFIAEIGGNFLNRTEAKRLVDAAVKMGCDAVKFQTFKADTITIKDNYFNLKNTGHISQYENFLNMELPEETQKFLVDYCDKKNILCFSSPGHVEDFYFLEKLKVKAYKLGSDVAIHVPLIEEIAKTGKPIFLSTGMCTLDEVATSVEACFRKGNRKVILLHCVSDYPADINEINLKAMVTLKKEFKLPVGYSDHVVGPEIALAAVAMGANVIERHLKHSRNKNTGPDIVLSSDEKEFQYIIDTSRALELASGSGTKKPTVNEKKNLKTNRVSICTLQDIEKGAKITRRNIDVRRPGTGIKPKFYHELIRDYYAKTFISKGTPLHFKNIYKKKK